MSKRLGKGLEALISDDAIANVSPANETIININNIEVNKHQPRGEFNAQKMDELIASIKENGILQPLTVRLISKNKVELIAGERRLRAAKKAGLNKVPVHYIDVDSDENMMVYALIENIQRDDLNPLEEAAGYSLLSEKYNLSHKEISTRVGKSRSEISNKMRLLKLSPQIKNSLRKKEINYGHAKAIGDLSSNKIQMILLKIKRENLSVRATEKLVRSISSKQKNIKKYSHKLLFIEELENQVIDIIGNKVEIKMTKNESGKIIINFYSRDNLDQIIKTISKIK